MASSHSFIVAKLDVELSKPEVLGGIGMSPVQFAASLHGVASHVGVAKFPLPRQSSLYFLPWVSITFEGTLQVYSMLLYAFTLVWLGFANPDLLVGFEALTHVLGTAQVGTLSDKKSPFDAHVTLSKKK